MYYGWKVVIFSGLIYTLVLSSTFGAFGLFVVPVSTDLGLSRGDTNTALIILNAGCALLAPVIGRLLDRISARHIMITAALLAGVGFSVISFSQSYWLSALMLAVPLAIFAQGGGMLTGSVLLARWFTAQRGRAMLLAFTGASVGGVVMAPAIGWLIGHAGWRTALLIIGLVVMTGLLTIALIIRERPRPGELEGSSTPPQGASDMAAAPAPTRPKSIGSLMAMPQFWTIGIGCALAMGMAQAMMITVVPMAMDAGLTALQAAGLISASSVAAVVTKLVLAVIADRFNRINLIASLLSLVVIVNALLLTGSTYPVLLGCSILLGIASSALSPLLQAILADRFGLASFGTVRGLTSPIISILGAVSIRVAGDVFDRFGGYSYLFTGFIGFGIVAVALMLATHLTRPVPAEG